MTDLQKNYRELFQASLNNWLKKNSQYSQDLLQLSNRSLDEMLNSQVQICEDNVMNTVVLRAMRFIMYQKSQKIMNEIEEVLWQCPSPHQTLFLLALSIVGREKTEYVFYTYQGKEWGDRPYGIDGLCIEPQAQIGKIKVDFLLTYELPTHQYVNASKKTKRMIIHCLPNHNSSSSELDNAFQTFGYLVMYCKETDLWSDPFGYAEQVIETLITHTAKKAPQL